MTYNQISSKQNCKTPFCLPLRCVWRTRGLWPAYVLMFSLKCVKGYFCGLTYVLWNAYWVPSPRCGCIWRWRLGSKVQWGRGMESWVNDIDEERDQESTLWARRGLTEPNRTPPVPDFQPPELREVVITDSTRPPMNIWNWSWRSCFHTGPVASPSMCAPCCQGHRLLFLFVCPASAHCPETEWVLDKYLLIGSNRFTVSPIVLKSFFNLAPLG